MNRPTDRPYADRQGPRPGQFDVSTRELIRRVLAGLEPAEVLSGPAREVVIRHWHAAGLSDLDMAARSAWSVHVVRRLRDRADLAPHPHDYRRDLPAWAG